MTTDVDYISDAPPARIPQDGVSLFGQALFLICFLTIGFWGEVCSAIIGALVTLQGIQMSTGWRAGRPSQAGTMLHIITRCLLVALLVHCFIGIGVHTRNPKCSLTRPLLWWTGFFVSSIVLLILVSQFFIIISGIYLRKAMLRRGLEGVYFFTDGTDELMGISDKCLANYGVTNTTRKAFDVQTLP